MAQYDFIAVYILTNQKLGTLYTGVTSDLPKRLEQHRTGTGAIFTKKYKLTRLVWFEPHETMGTAFQRERRIKEWKRSWKIGLIEKDNPDWFDLTDRMI